MAAALALELRESDRVTCCRRPYDVGVFNELCAVKSSSTDGPESHLGIPKKY